MIPDQGKEQRAVIGIHDGIWTHLCWRMQRGMPKDVDPLPHTTLESDTTRIGLSDTDALGGAMSEPPDPSSLYLPRCRHMVAEEKSYFLFMLRELSSVFIGCFCGLPCPNLSVNQRPRPYHRFYTKLSSPGWIFSMWWFCCSPLSHVTWFKLQPWYYGSVGESFGSRQAVTTLHIVAG